MNTKHLWECDHAYYCNLGNYFATGADPCCVEYDDWAEFVEAEGDSDMDYNLLFRWDWKEEDDEGEPTTDGTGTLYLFWMGQRKGLYRWSEVQVHRDDEPAIREWLLPRMSYLFSLWEPLNDGPRAALEAADRLCKEALPKFNWAASFLDANAIQLLNETPALIAAALESLNQEEPK